MVQIAVVSVPDGAAVLDFPRKVVIEGAGEKIGKRLKIIDPPGDSLDIRAAEFKEREGDGGKLLEGVADSTEFAWVADAILEAAEDTDEVPDLAESIAEFGGEGRLANETADDGFAPEELVQIPGRREQPLLKESGSSSGDGAVDRLKEAAFPGVGSAAEDLEVALSGGVEKEQVVEAMLPDGGEVSRGVAEFIRGVVNNGSGGGEGGVIGFEAKAFEVEDTEGFGEAGKTGFDVELIGVDPGEGPVLDKVSEPAEKGVSGGVPFEGIKQLFGNEDLARIEAGKEGEKTVGAEVILQDDFKKAGGKVHPGCGEALSIGLNGKKKVVAIGIELVTFEKGSRGEDASEFPPDELTSPGGLNLVADGDFFPLVEELINVGLGGVVGDASHGHLMAPSQGDSKQARPLFGVLVEDLVKIAKAEKEEGIGWQLISEPVPLLHHGGCFLLYLGHEKTGSKQVQEGCFKAGVSRGWKKGGGLKLAGGFFPRDTDLMAAEKLFERFLGGEGNPPLVILHGLLGSSRNWKAAGEGLTGAFSVTALDLRNHGNSPWADTHGYGDLVEDLGQWLDGKGLEKATIMGHSMGGKAGMLFACTYPERVEQLYIADISPRDYDPQYSDYLRAMKAIDTEALKSRAEAEDRLEEVVESWGMRQFLLTNLIRDEAGDFRWQVNIDVLLEAMPELAGNPLDAEAKYVGPTLFLRGGRSLFIRDVDRSLIRKHFPKSHLVTLKEAGHNVHVDDRETFVESVVEARRYFEAQKG